MISGSTLDVGGNQPEFSVNVILSKQSANFILWSIMSVCLYVCMYVRMYACLYVW